MTSHREALDAAERYFGLRRSAIPKFFQGEPLTISMRVPLALDVQPMDQVRYGAGHCLVCGRKLESGVSHLWGARHIKYLVWRIRRWWHHRKCEPWTIVRVSHEWRHGEMCTTSIEARGLPPRFTWWDKLLGRPRRVDLQIMQYEISRGR
jgi:hypothetical protein